MKTPNLFIVGQPKAGTTALQYLLDQHPEIFVLNHGSYFGKDSLKKIQKITKKEYLNKFLAAKEKKVIGDSSEQCFYSESAPREIKSFNPDSKIIILLREPLEWLRSAYQQKYRNLKENRSILEAIYSDEYLEKTKYAKYIKNYLKYFPKRNMKIILFEDFKKHNEEVLKEIFQFLGVDNEFVPPSKEMNPSRTLRFRNIQFALDKIGLRRRKIRGLILEPMWSLGKKFFYKKEKIEIPERAKEELKKKLKPEVKKINDLLHKEGFLDKSRNLVKEWGY